MTIEMPIAAGPRKRLLDSDCARRWNEGDVVKNLSSGENLFVLRVDQRGALVRRGRGTLRAQPIREGDRFVTLGQLNQTEGLT